MKPTQNMSRKFAVPAKTNRYNKSDGNRTESNASSQQNAVVRKKSARKQDKEEEKKMSRKRKHASPTAEKAKKVTNIIQLVIRKPKDEEEELVTGVFGYLPLEAGRILNRRYQIIKLVGSGTYSSVWMAKDTQTQNTVAVKVGRSGEKYNVPAKNEIDFMRMTRGSPNIVTLIDHFTVEGEHGKHVAMVSEILGPDLLAIIRYSNQGKLTVDRIKMFCRDILKGLYQLHHQCNIIHLDLKTENIMLAVGAGETDHDSYDINLADPSCSAFLKIGDLGLATKSTDLVTREVQTRHFRAPEAFLKSRAGAPADIWSFGCIAFEMATGYLLFPGMHTDEEDPNFSYFAQIAEVVGPIKERYFEKTEANEDRFQHLFRGNKVFKRDAARGNPLSPSKICEKSTMCMIEATEFSEFLSAILQVDPKKRPTAEEALELPFLNN